MQNITSKKTLFLLLFSILTSYMTFAQTSEVTVSITWPSNAGENYVRIRNPLNNIVRDICAPGNCYNGANVSYTDIVDLGCLTNGNNYLVEVFDRASNGWSAGSNITISVNGVAVVNGNLNGGGYGSANFNVSGTSISCSSPEIDVYGNNILITDNDTTPNIADNTSFGTTTAGNNIDKVFEIRNTGTGNLILSGIPVVSFSGAGAANFSVLTQPSGTIVPGTSAFFTVRFNRLTAGTSVATINMPTNDSNETNYNFDITATATAAGSPEIDVYGNNILINDNDTTPSATDNTAFGTTSLSTNLDRVFEIRNTGSAVLNLTGTPRVALSGAGSGNFTILAQPAGTVSPGSSVFFTVRFNSTTASTSLAIVTIQSNDTNEATYNFSISATAENNPEIDMYGNGTLISDDDITPSPVDNTSFGSVVVNTALDKVFEIRNTGTAALNLTGTPRVVITGANAANFVVLAQPGTTVSAGSSSFFTVRFTSAVAGVNNATLTILSNDSNESTYNFNITATAAPVSAPTATTATLYYENFDGGANGWISNTSAGSTWTLGRNGEQGEGDYWYTNSYNDYIPNQRITLTSPLIPTTGFTDLVFHLDYRIKSEAGDDGMMVEYSLDGGLIWTTLGSSTTGTNWYNDNDVDAIANNASGWSGDNSILDSSLSRFEEATHILPLLANNNPLVRFRITFAADSDTNVDDGAMIDNIIITGNEIVPSFASTGPANVSNNLTLWLDSKTIGQVNNTPLLSWNDRALNNHAFEIPANAPVFTDNPVDNVNFNSTVTFNRAAQQHLRGKGGFNSNDYWVVVRSNIAVSNAGANETMLIGAKQAAVSPTKDPSGLGWGPVSARYTNEVLSHNIGTVSTNDPSDGSYGRAFTDSSRTFEDVQIINVKNNSSNNQTNIYLNGRKIDNTTGRTTVSSQTLNFSGFLNQPYYLGVGRYTMNGEPFESHLNGQLTEVFSFADRLGDAPQQRIYSYLAIKNGVSLHNPASTLVDNRADWDYLDSSNGIIWNAAANTTFNYDVAAIGRDDTSQLVQKQSKSEHSSSIIAIGLNRVEDLGSQNTATFLDDKDFLFWGHNGADLNQNPTPLTYDLGTTNNVTITMNHINRIWKIQDRVTTDMPVVQLRVAASHMSGLGTLAADERYVLIVADDASLSVNVETSVFKNEAAFLRTRYDFKGIKYFTLGKTRLIKDDRSVTFDGINDVVEILDGKAIAGTFSTSAWILNNGANSTNTNRAIVAKRSGTTGFELSLNPSNRVEVYWFNGTSQLLVSNTAIATGAWRYITTTFDGTTMKLYIDGVLDNQIGMSTPASDDNILALGARKENNGNVINPFNGEIDEVRIWDIALTQDVLRYVMNQELIENSNIVQGTVLPLGVTKNETALLNWSSLAGYYSMNTYIGTALNDDSVNDAIGRLGNKDYYDLKAQTAPLPYISANNGVWENQTSWSNGSQQFAPGSTRLINGVIEDIQWNIVKTSHEVTITSKDVSVLGLFVESNTLNVSNDHGLAVTHYLKLNGKIDLKDESQLIQTTNSDLDPTSTGTLERDQQGTADKFNYNYWSSPVGISNATTNNNNFTITGVVKDGTLVNNPRTLNFTSASVGDGAPGNSTTAATISSRWLYKYGNQTSGQYSNWQFIGATGSMRAGEGWTMKGTGTAASNQNYVFVGKPNNGDINLNINAGNDYLVGNPYPSALDSHEFLMDNPELNGTLYFWEHWGGNSHQLQLYQGGYAMYNLSGGLGNATFGTSHPSVNQGGIATKEPGRFIPVAQAFFVTGTSNGTIKFRNDQRQFVKESSGNSVFVAAPGSTAQTNVFSDYNTVNDLRSKFRIGFDSPGVIHRQLLLTIDPNATAGYDKLYDGDQYDEQFDDIAFKLGSKKLAIQGIPSVDYTTELPLTVKLSNAGSITIKLDNIAHVSPTAQVFLKDATLQTYTNLMTTNYVSPHLWAGVYGTRFSIVFAEPSTLSNSDVLLGENDLILYTPEGANTLNVKKGVDLIIETLTITNMLGQQVQQFKTDDQYGIVEVPTAGIASGSYIVTMQTSLGVVTRKVILQ